MNPEDMTKRPEDIKYCTSTVHPTGHTVPATHALSIVFSFSRRGFPPKTTQSYVGLYCCDTCATPFTAQAIKAKSPKFMDLGYAIMKAINADTLNWDKTKFEWRPRAKADEFFQRVTQKELERVQVSQKQLLDTPVANDPERPS